MSIFTMGPLIALPYWGRLGRLGAAIATVPRLLGWDIGWELVAYPLAQMPPLHIRDSNFNYFEFEP